MCTALHLIEIHCRSPRQPSQLAAMCRSSCNGQAGSQPKLVAHAVMTSQKGLHIKRALVSHAVTMSYCAGETVRIRSSKAPDKTSGACRGLDPEVLDRSWNPVNFGAASSHCIAVRGGRPPYFFVLMDSHTYFTAISPLPGLQILNLWCMICLDT